MTDLRAINCFVSCARTGSFSKAAEELFTTQSSVSKIIKNMETELGYPLFERQAKGIRLTCEGKNIYPYAVAVLDNVQKRQLSQKNKAGENLSVSCNPSSWFADVFVQFYSSHKTEKIHYQVYSAGSREVAERVREREDDIGFVYIMQKQLSAFQYYLSRNYLEFQALKETDIMAYPGADYRETDEANNLNFKDMKLIQRFPDEFSPDNYWNLTDINGDTASEADMVITTNSDYIMERILQISDLVNISGGYLSGKPWREGTEGKKMAGMEAQVIFGYIRRKGEDFSAIAQEFVEFVTLQLQR